MIFLMIHNNKHLFSALMLLSLSAPIFGQYPNHTLPEYPDEWNSRWITHPDIDQAAYGLIHFRKELRLQEKPDQFVVHVSGDNRYRLYVNGGEVCYGPQLADLRHWRYESIDLAPFLKKGKNIIAAEVMNWGIDRSYGIISYKTAFLLQGNSEQETMLNTTYDSGWKVLKNEGMYEKTVHWMTSGEIVGGFYAANPTDSVVADQYPWGWKDINYDDSQWKEPEVIFSKPKTDAGAGHGWIMQPRTTAIQKSAREAFKKIIRSNIKGLSNEYSFGNEPLAIPANSSYSILIDQGYVTVGYPKLQLSGGRGAILKIKYSEALYDDKNQKGNRNEYDGKVIKGMSDLYVMDGGKDRVFQPLWLRTFRFLQLEIETKEEALSIDDCYNVYSATDFPVVAKFEVDDAGFQQVWDI